MNCPLPRGRLLQALWSRRPCAPRARARVGMLPLVAAACHAVSYNQGDHALYLSEYSSLVADSYTEPLPPAIAATCRAKGLRQGTPEEVELAAGVHSAVQAQAACGTSATCVVASGATLRMDGDLNVGALLVRGRVVWDETSQQAAEQWLCGGYVVVAQGGLFNMSLRSGTRRGWIYLKANGAAHLSLGQRVFGGSQSTIDVAGRALRRTWSLLAAPAAAGTGTIALLHDPIEAGWAVGDRIAIAPTEALSSGTAESRTVTAARIEL